MTAIGIHHVSIGSHDVAASIEFFGWLGLTVVQTRPDFPGIKGAWLQAGEQQVHLIGTTKDTPGIENHFAFIVEDLDATLDVLRAHGVEGRRSAHVAGAGYQAFVHDPSGNVIELNQSDHEPTIAAI